MSEVATLSPPPRPPGWMAASAFERLGGAKRGFTPPPALKRAIPLLAGLAIVATIIAAVLLLRAPDRAQLFPGLSDGDKAAVVSALETGGFDVSVDPATGAVAVPAGDVYRARMALAAQGLPKAVPGGYDLLADMPLGASRALERARMKQAQETELARAIEGVGGVSSARVMLALPEPTPFVRETAKPSASVFVTLQSGRAMGEAQVRAIQHLVATSVPGLAVERVSVVDGGGQLLSSDGEGGEMGETQRQLTHQLRLERLYRERIAALLGPVLGPGNFSAQVNLDLDYTRAEQTSERYQPANTALRSEATQTRSDSTPQPRGIPGALTNSAPPAPIVAATPPPGAPAATPAALLVAPTNTEASATRNFEVGRDVSVTRPATGRIRKMTVAVVVRAEVAGAGAPSPQALQRLISAALGFDAARGDLVTVVRQPFAVAAAEPPLPVWREMVEDHSGHLVALVAVLAVALLARPFLKRARAPAPRAADPAGEPVTTTLTPVGGVAAGATPAQLAAAEAAAAALAPPAPEPAPPPSPLEIEDQMARYRPKPNMSTDILSAANTYDDKVAAIRIFVGEDAARASSVLKQLLRQPVAGVVA